MAFSVPFHRAEQHTPFPYRSTLQRLKALGGMVASFARPARVPLQNLAHYPLFAAGSGLMDFAAFHVGHGWGWLATGLSLVVIEHVIADET